jgi:hypothetical protein
MARVEVDLFQPFSSGFKRRLYEATYDVVNYVHYASPASERKVGDVSVLFRTPDNLGLGITPDFDIELMIMEGSDNWPRCGEGELLVHDEAKKVLDERAERISRALRELFPAPSHAVMENAQATGWVTYMGKPDQVLDADYDRSLYSKRTRLAL